MKPTSVADQERATPSLLTRATVMRDAFESAGVRPRTRAGLVKEPAWQIQRNSKGASNARKAR